MAESFGKFNIKHAVRGLLQTEILIGSLDPSTRNILERTIDDHDSKARNQHELLDHLSMLLLIPQLTLHVANLFRPILIDLVSRWLLLDINQINENNIIR